MPKQRAKFRASTGCDLKCPVDEFSSPAKQPNGSDKVIAAAAADDDDATPPTADASATRKRKRRNSKSTR